MLEMQKTIDEEVRKLLAMGFIGKFTIPVGSQTWSWSKMLAESGGFVLIILTLIGSA